MLKIGEFSKLSRVSIRMLRHYDELELLVPETIDPFTGYRYYSEKQLPVAGRITALKDMGFGLSAVREIWPVMMTKGCWSSTFGPNRRSFRNCLNKQHIVCGSWKQPWNG